MKNRTLIIAEAGVNHNGNINMAKKLIDVASEAGADYVKFQTFKAANLVSGRAKKADYQKKNTDRKDDSQLTMLKELELSEDQHLELIAYCISRNIKFLSTAFDLESIDLLEKLNTDLYKIPSGEITNYPFLKKISQKKKPIILSTGMSSMEEISEALEVFYQNDVKKDSITVLHCNTQYPSPMKDVNLKAMISIGESFGIKYGYSDHTEGIEVPIAAVALGALVIEKHFTLDKELPGPDHKASLDPIELKNMIVAIRNIENALGNGIKQVTDSEKFNKIAARKSIHFAKSLPKGHLLTENDLIMKRPGDGISPMQLSKVLNKKLKIDVAEDDMFRWEDIQ